MAKKNKSNGEAEIESNIRKVTEIEARQRQNRTAGERISEGIASFAGSMAFIYIHIVWFGGWILANSVAPFEAFDPFPYTFLTLIVSLEAIFLSTFILISQNHETKLAERRNHLDLQINMLAEQESTRTLELLQLIAQKIGVTYHDEKTKSLLEPVDPTRLVKKIEEVKEKSQ